MIRDPEQRVAHAEELQVASLEDRAATYAKTVIDSLDMNERILSRRADAAQTAERYWAEERQSILLSRSRDRSSPSPVRTRMVRARQLL